MPIDNILSYYGTAVCHYQRTGNKMYTQEQSQYPPPSPKKIFFRFGFFGKKTYAVHMEVIEFNTPSLIIGF